MVRFSGYLLKIICNSQIPLKCTYNQIATHRTKPRVLLSHGELPHCVFDILADKYELVISKGFPFPTRETLLKNIRGVDGVLWFSLISFDKEMIEAAGDQLKIVSRMGVGLDHIDLKLLQERNIKFTYTPNIGGAAVADMAVGLALAVSRNILQGNNIILKNKWVANHPTWLAGPALEGATVGVVGMGDIGSKVARRVRAFDTDQLLYFNRKESPQAAELGAQYVPLDELLSRSDFVFVTVPLTPETTNLLDKTKFRLMKPNSIVINVARGGVINQEDLVDALEKKMIGGAGLDVMTPEPLPHNHVLTTLPNVVLTPHIGSASIRAREAMARQAAENICKFLPT